MFKWIALIISFFLLFWIGKFLFFYLYKNRWLVYIPRYSRKSEPAQASEPIHLYVAICDHYQPFWGQVSQEIAEHRVVTWCREYPRIACLHTDCRGRHPIHTFFYSEEDYNPRLIDSLQRLSKDDLADVELLLAHQNDSPENLRRKIEEFRDVLFHHHGLLRKDMSGQITYGFIHGYWALNNARPDGRKCGINNEIPILKESGCYADFTYPSAPDITQPPITNSIYFASDTPGKPKAHEKGTPASTSNWSQEDLLFIQGPLALNWRKRSLGIMPSIENGGISSKSPFLPSRADLWVKSGVHIPGIPNHVFVKLFTHGSIDHTIRYFFGEDGLCQLWSYLENHYNDGIHYKLYYVSAWEMYQVIRNKCFKTALDRNIKTIED
jgi:hypothetical protein